MTARRKPRDWIIETGEPARAQGGEARKMRAGLLADELASQGAEVTSWVSTWEHQQKRSVGKPGQVAEIAEGQTLRYLHGRPYHENVSWRRVRAQAEVAADFSRRAPGLEGPDIIHCCYPTIDLADVATRYGRERNIPVVVDVRDMWPDVFAQVLPGPAALWAPALAPLRARARRALGRATSLVSITEEFLQFSLDLAGRSRRALDAVFVHAYRRHDLTDEQAAAADAFWREKGLTLDGREFILCYFGNLSDLPNFRVVIDSMRRMSGDLGQNLRLVVCGVGSQQASLLALARSDPRLLVPGYVDRTQIATLMKHAGAGLLPYPQRADLLLSYPNKVGEYLSEGLPILATLGGATGRLLEKEHCGIVVAGDHVAEMAAGLEALAGPKGVAMKFNARRIYRDMFDANHVYAGMARHLASIAASARLDG